MTDKEIIDGLYEIKNWKCNGDSKMYSIIRGAIDLLEQTRWRPVSEPPKNVNDVVILTSGEVIALGWFSPKNNKWYRHYDEVSLEEHTVEAWFDIPEHFREEEENETNN